MDEKRKSLGRIVGHNYSDSPMLDLTVGKEYFGHGECDEGERHRVFLDDVGNIRAAHYFVFDTGVEVEVPNPKAAYGKVKAPMNTIPPTALIQMANVMAGGAHKYGLFNFRESKVDVQTYIGAINRHFMLWQDGVDNDNESGMSHLAHTMACCAILIDAQYTGQLVDNRAKTGLVEGMLEDSSKEFSRFCEEVKSVL